MKLCAEVLAKRVSIPILKYAKGVDIGKNYPNPVGLVRCIDCGSERWVLLYKAYPTSIRCAHCAGKLKRKHVGETHHNWKGGKVKCVGYNAIKLSTDDFYYPMVNLSGYVLEHRLVVAKYLGRCLQSWEIVHHKNHIKTDNRLCNLQLVTDDRHKQITVLENKIHRLEQRITLLEADNIILRKQLTSGVNV